MFSHRNISSLGQSYYAVKRDQTLLLSFTRRVRVEKCLPLWRFTILNYSSCGNTNGPFWTLALSDPQFEHFYDMQTMPVASRTYRRAVNTETVSNRILYRVCFIIVSYFSTPPSSCPTKHSPTLGTNPTPCTLHQS